MNNTILDNDDVGAIKEMVTVCTECLSMNLASRGLRVRMHRRGEPLGNNPVDLSESPTNDPPLDMTVSRCERFGCDFEGGIYPSIKENLIIFHLSGERGRLR